MLVPPNGDAPRKPQRPLAVERRGPHDPYVRLDRHHHRVTRVADPHVRVFRGPPGDLVAPRRANSSLGLDHVGIQPPSQLIQHVLAHAYANLRERHDVGGLGVGQRRGLHDPQQVLRDLAAPSHPGAVKAADDDDVQVLRGEIVGLDLDPPGAPLARRPLGGEVLDHQALLLLVDPFVQRPFDVVAGRTHDAIGILRLAVRCRDVDLDPAPRHFTSRRRAAALGAEWDAPVGGDGPGSLPVAVVVVVIVLWVPLDLGRDGSEQTFEDGVPLAKRPVDDRMVRVVQHVERDVHQLEVPHEQRLLPVRELVVRYPRPVLVVLVVPRPVLLLPFLPVTASRPIARRLQRPRRAPPVRGVDERLEVPERHVRLVFLVPQHELAVQHAPVRRQPPAKKPVHHGIPARSKVEVVPGEVVEGACVHPVHLYALAVELVLDDELPPLHVPPRLVAVPLLRGVHRADERTGLEVLALERDSLGVQSLAHPAQVAAHVVEVLSVPVEVPDDGGLAVPELHVLDDDRGEPTHLPRVHLVHQAGDDWHLLVVGLERGELVEGIVDVPDGRAIHPLDVAVHHVMRAALLHGVDEDAGATLAPRLELFEMGRAVTIQAERQTDYARESRLLEVVGAPFLVDVRQHQAIQREEPRPPVVDAALGHLSHPTVKDLPLLAAPLPPGVVDPADGLEQVAQLREGDVGGIFG